MKKNKDSLKLITTTTLLTVIGLFLFQCQSSFEEIEDNFRLDDIKNKKKVTQSSYPNKLKVINSGKNILHTSQMFGDNNFQFKATKNNTLFFSSFNIKNKQGETVYETKYSLDTSIKNYKLHQGNKVIEIANALDYSLKLDEYIILEKYLKIFIKSIIFQNKDTENTILINSLFFHNSILGSKKRSLEIGETDCECTLHPGYLLNKTGFFCQEDYLMDVNRIKEIINNNKKNFLDSSSLAFLEFLNGTTKKNIRFNELYEFYVKKELYIKTLQIIKARSEEQMGDCSSWCPLGCGSDWGCCGNYSGCCFYSNSICFIHDGLCTNCSLDWFCFSGCVPDDGNSEGGPIETNEN